MSRVQIEEVTLEVEVTWVMAALRKVRDDKINILPVSKTTGQKWHGKTIEALIQTVPDFLENIPDCLIFGEEKVLKVFIQRNTYMSPVSQRKQFGEEEDKGKTIQPV